MALPKILFYTPGLVDGGAERLWSCLASAFAHKGHDVVFAVDFEAAENRSNLSPDIPLHVLGTNHLLATRRLATLIARERPDVALSAVAGSNLKLAIAAVWSGAAPALVSSYHGFDEGRTGWMSYLTYKLLPLLSRRVTRIIAVSDELKSHLVARWGADAAKTVVLPNPVFYPDDASAPAREDLAGREEIVLAAGRLAPEKDYVTLIRAFARMERPRARLVILGKGPELDRLEKEVARFGLEDRVLMPGYVAEPWDYYRKAKCFAVSSQTESFGNVVVEALAYGLPVVATACSGPMEILSKGAFGTVVPIGDERALSLALSAALDDPGDPAPRNRRAHEYSFERRLPAYEALIRRVIADASGPSLRSTIPAHGRT